MVAETKEPARAGLSLKARLGVGTALLGAGTLLTSGILYVGMTRVAERLDTALASEMRMARYATLSTQAATFIVVATESIQTGLAADVRAARVEPVVGQLRTTFDLLRSDVEHAVEAAEDLGIDEQSRYGTQSLGLARMEAMLQSAMQGLTAETDDRVRLRAHVDSFASAFDPLLNQAVNTEVLFRNNILSGIERVRRSLTLAAFAISGLTLLAAGAFYVGFIRPLFRRLDRLRAAALQVGREDFSVSLPDTSGDEVGQLYAETNRMAAALSTRQQEVRAEWDRLNEVIAQRTAELSAANATLEEIDENRRRLFADVSHELRTPLTVIMMEAQLGRQHGADTATAFRTIEARSERLNRRIDDLLRVARSDTGQLALDIKETSLSSVAAEAIEEVQAELDTAGMQLIADDIQEISIACDPNWLRQTLVSVIRNTIRHARAGGLVRLASEVREKTAGLAVTDNGPGIPAAEHARIFDRFAQGGAGKGQGFGIGLALAKWVTEAQQGEIAVVSPVPEADALGERPGTKISVRLPRAGQ